MGEARRAQSRSLASRLRTVVRSVAVFACTTFWWLVLLFGKTLLWFSKDGRNRLRRFVLRNWGRSTLWLAGGRRLVQGTAPREPGLFVTNHLSYADVLLLAAEVPGRFVAKAEIRDWPYVSWLCRTADVLFVDRKSRHDTARVAAQMEEALAAGDTLILFPEGTSSSGHSILPFRAPLLAPAAAARLPVHYGAVHYETSPGDPPAFLSICWWGDAPLFPHLPELLGLQRFTARLRFGQQPLRAEDRKVLARQLEAAVAELFEPVIDYEPHSPSDPRPRPLVEAERLDTGEVRTASAAL